MTPDQWHSLSGLWTAICMLVITIILNVRLNQLSRRIDRAEAKVENMRELILRAARAKGY